MFGIWSSGRFRCLTVTERPRRFLNFAKRLRSFPARTELNIAVLSFAKRNQSNVDCRYAQGQQGFVVLAFEVWVKC